MAARARLASKAYSPYKAEILVLTLLGFAGGILEGIGINAIIPLLTVVLNLHDPATDMLSQAVQSLFVFVGVPFLPRTSVLPS